VVGRAGQPRRRSAAQRQEDASLRAILDANADGVVVVDRDGIVCFANPAAEQLFARRAAELVGGVFGFPLVAGATTELDVVRQSGESCVVEMRVVGIEWQGRPAYLASLRDITERKRAEVERAELLRLQAERLQAEAALRARDEFLASTAHELKTPLTRLRLSVQRARRQLGKEDERPPDYVRKALRQIELESDHLSRLVSQLLDLSRLESRTFAIQRSRTDLGQLVEAVAARAQATLDEDRLLIRTPPEPVLVSVDREAVEQIVASAIGSALRFSPPGASVEVELTTDPVSGSSAPAAGTARLAVRDRGMAVPPEDRARLFGRSVQIYSNAYVSGLGLWLYASRQLAALHGGGIDVEFPDDGGTRVVLSLPLDFNDPPPCSEPAGS